MKNGKYVKRRGVATKTMMIVLAVMLVVGCSIGGTLAWLTATSGPVTNTFTVGNITIELDENVKSGFKVVPGATETKDPFVTVEKGSEPCYVYVKVSNDLLINGTSVVTWNIDESQWIDMGTATESDGTIVTLYRYNGVVDASSDEMKLPIFTTVTYDATAITKDNISGLNNKTIVIDAFAHQSENTTQTVADTAAKTWAGIGTATN